MTTDLEQRLRDSLERDASEAPRIQRAPEGLLRRVRRRQAGTTAAATVAGLAAVVALAFAVVQLTDADDRYVPTPRQQVDRIVVAEGEEPAGAWTLEITVRASADGSDLGAGLHTYWAAGSSHGGSATPLEGHTFSSTSRWYSSEIGILEIFGPVSPDAARVVFEPEGASGPVEARLFPIPDRFLGPAQVFLVMIDGAEPSPGAEGRLIAYDADGNVLDRVSVS